MCGFWRDKDGECGGQNLVLTLGYWRGFGGAWFEMRWRVRAEACGDDEDEVVRLRVGYIFSQRAW